MTFVYNLFYIQTSSEQLSSQNVALVLNISPVLIVRVFSMHYVCVIYMHGLITSPHL